MAVSESYKTFVLEQLARVTTPVTRHMFGGVGIYANDLFFALIGDDVLYFKVDDTNRPDFEEAGMEPFRPYGDDRSMNYYQVPIGVLEDSERLTVWVGRAIDVARRAREKKSS